MNDVTLSNLVPEYRFALSRSVHDLQHCKNRVIGVIVLGIVVSCAAVGVVFWEIHDSVQEYRAVAQKGWRGLDQRQFEVS